MDAPEGVRPDSSKGAAIQSMQPPDDVKSLQNFLGLVNCLTSYSARLATITAPLREFTEETVIQTDASMKWLGASLLQNGQSVCYASNRAKL